MKKLRIGFIGNGKSTNRYHAPYILNRKDTFELKMIYNRTIDHTLWKEIPDVKYTDNLDELLNSEEIDVIEVTTPSQFHYEYAKKVLEAGKNCICEKPFAETIAQAKELFNIAKDNGLIIEAYQNRRFDADFLTVQKVIESGKLGDLIEVEMHFDYYRPEVSENIHDFTKAKSYYYEIGCHVLDQVISYFGKPDNVHYDVRQLLGTGRMNDYFDIDFYYGNIKVSVKSSYFRVKQRPAFVVYGKKGMFVHNTKDIQETQLKEFIMPWDKGFGIEPEDKYGTISYYDEYKEFHEEKIVSEIGDYGKYYDALYETIINAKEKLVKDEETILQLEMLENGIKLCK